MAKRHFSINTCAIQYRLHAHNIVKLVSISNSGFLHLLCYFVERFMHVTLFSRTSLNTLFHKPSHWSRHLSIHLYFYLAVTKQRNKVWKENLQLDKWILKGIVISDFLDSISDTLNIIDFSDSTVWLFMMFLFQLYCSVIHLDYGMVIIPSLLFLLRVALYFIVSSF